jgi:hypothetical protein
MHKSDGRFVVTFRSFSVAYAGEYTPTGVRTAVYRLESQQALSLPAVSMNGAGRYLVCYIGVMSLSAAIFGRFGGI